MVGSYLDSSQSKANEILNRSSVGGEKDENSSTKFVDENSSKSINSGEPKKHGGIQPRNFYSVSPSSRGAQMLNRAAVPALTDTERLLGPSRRAVRNSVFYLISLPSLVVNGCIL
jgi:hypothetical protein